jgi:hypothetical protein
MLVRRAFRSDVQTFCHELPGNPDLIARPSPQPPGVKLWVAVPSVMVSAPLGASSKT